MWRVFDKFEVLIDEHDLFSNDTIMMYSPLLPESEQKNKDGIS